MSSTLLELNVRKPLPNVIQRAQRPKALVVGVDGGGTGTRAVIMDEKQRVLGQGESGPSNPLRIGIAKAVNNVREAIDRACAEAAVHRDDISIATVGLAGVRRKDIHQCTLEKLNECLKEIRSIELLPDGEIGRLSVLRDWRGLAVGEALLKAVINEAEQRGLNEQKLSAQVQAVEFYQRFGFTIVSDEFLEAGLPHVDMVRKAS